MDGSLFASDEFDSFLNFTSLDTLSSTASTTDHTQQLEENQELLSFDASQILNGQPQQKQVEFQQPFSQKKVTLSSPLDMRGSFEEELYQTQQRKQSIDESMMRTGSSMLSNSMSSVPQKQEPQRVDRGVSDFPVKRRKSEPNIRAPMATSTSYNTPGQEMMMSALPETHAMEPVSMERRSSFALTSDPIFGEQGINLAEQQRRNSFSAQPGAQYGGGTGTYPPARRNSISQSPPPAQGKREFDALWAKSKLLDMLYGEKNIENFCAQVVNFVCNYMKMHVAGFYLNLQKQWNVKEWNLAYAFPSVPVFSKFFHYSLGSRQIMQASLERRCFCVHNTQLKNNDSLSFMFVPLPSEEGRKFSLGVMVLGTILHSEQDLHTHLLFLDQIRRAIYVPFLTILCLQEKSNLMQGLDVLVAENQILKKRNRFERALVSLLAAAENTYGKRVSIICSNTSGLITYVSPGTEQLLGYAAAELVGSNNLLKVHYPAEIVQRAKELESELNKRVIPGLGVIVERTMRNRGKEDVRNWTYIRKDGSLLPVRVIIKPLHDDKSIFGFVEIATDVNQDFELGNQAAQDLTIDPSQFFNQNALDFSLASPAAIPQSPLPSGTTNPGNWMLQNMTPQQATTPGQADLSVLDALGNAPPATPNSVSDLMRMFEAEGTTNLEDLNIDKWF